MGIDGNEQADQAAKEGANSNNIETYIPKPWCETLKIVEDLIQQEWDLRWQDDKQYIHTKFFFPHINTTQSKHILKYSRGYVQLLVRAMTGHNFLAKHQNRIGNAVAPECRLCEEDFETFIHLLTTCPRLSETRQEVFLDKDPAEEWKPHKIIKFIKTTIVDEMLLEKDNYQELPIICLLYTSPSPRDS